MLQFILCICFWVADRQAANFSTKHEFNFHLISSFMKYQFVCQYPKYLNFENVFICPLSRNYALVKTQL